MASIKAIKKEVLENVKPTKHEEELLLHKAEDIINQLRKSLRKIEFTIGGSLGKGTWLRHTHDIDIYVKFPKGSNTISQKLKTALDKHFKNVELVHGSRDYYHIKENNLTIELIPIINIEKTDDIENITDASPFHLAYVLEHKKYQDEIRVTKQFFKANKLYGAESYIKGFSGYVLELLVIHYKSFDKFLRAAAKWKEKKVLDPKKHWKQPLRALNKSKISSPLVLVDPVQKDRNVASSVDKEKYDQLIIIAKDFLKNPSEEYFKIKKLNIKDLKRRGKQKDLVILKAYPLKGKVDVVGAKLLKVFNHIRDELTFNDFNLIESDWDWDKVNPAIMWFISSKDKLPKYKKHFGPPITEKERLKSFQKKHKWYSLKLEGKAVFIEKKRKYRRIKYFIKKLIWRNKYIKEKVKKIKLKRF